jgi:hypothetical protein
MIIFVLLNLLCFIIILAKCIWADKGNWNRTTHNIISVFSPYHPQLELTNFSNDEMVDATVEDDCKDCDHCSRYNGDSDVDNSDDNNPLTDSSISTPSVVPGDEPENPENQENPENYSGNGSESDESIVVLDSQVNYFKKAQGIVQCLKDELEKKND